MTDISSKDNLGDRMKQYEAVETTRRLDKHLPIYARIDGRGFSKFTKGMLRPFDVDMTNAMVDTTHYLVEQTGAIIGYNQSDEISLAWYEADQLKDMFFGGKVQKLASVLASMATAAFTRAVLATDGSFPKYAARLPHFDCRVFNLPSTEEIANAFLWRELDATRNAVSMVAYDKFPAPELHGVSTKELRVKLADIGVEFEEFPAAFKRGTYVQRRSVMLPLSPETLAGIPEHNRPHPGTLFSRSRVESFSLPPLLTIANRVDVMFGAEPVLL